MIKVVYIVVSFISPKIMIFIEIVSGGVSQIFMVFIFDCYIRGLKIFILDGFSRSLKTVIVLVLGI